MYEKLTNCINNQNEIVIKFKWIMTGWTVVGDLCGLPLTGSRV